MESGILIVGISGGSGSGKTTLAQGIIAALGLDTCAVLAQDSYYIDQSARFDGDGGSVNFDHPSSLDFALLARHLHDLRSGRSVEVPIYDFATHSRRAQTSSLRPKPILIVDGTLLYSQAPIVAALNYRIFVDTPESDRYRRRLKRDVEERGRKPEGVERQFLTQVKPMHDEFIEPNKTRADFIVSGLAGVREALEQSLAKIRALR